MRSKSRKSEDHIAFTLLMAVTFAAMLVVTIIKRALPWNWGHDNRSIFQAAKTAAYSCVPFAFM
jgi:hypothetical protein